MDLPETGHKTRSQAWGECPPPPKSKPDSARDESGNAQGHRPHGTALGALCTGTTRGARATLSRGWEKGADDVRARAHTHAKDTRGIREGQPHQARGTHRPHGRAYQRARVRDIRTRRPATRSAANAGREGGNGEDTTPDTGPSPPDLPQAPRTHEQGPAPAKAIVAHRATHQLRS